MAQQTRNPVRTGPRVRPSPHDVSVVCGVMCLAAVAGVVGLADGGIDLGPEITSRLPVASPALAAAGLGAAVAVPMGAAAVAGLRRSPRPRTLRSSPARR